MTFHTYSLQRKGSDCMEDLTEEEREADLQAAKAHRELAEEPLLMNNPYHSEIKDWHISEAERLEGYGNRS